MTDKAQTGTIQGTVGWEDITSIDGGTGTSCVAHFGKIYENYLSLWSPLLPAHYLATTTVTDAVNKLYTQTDPAKGVYSGPYIPTAWAAGAQTDLKPNPKFWETIKKAQAPFDSVTFRYYSDTAAEIAGFSKGEIDTALEFNHTHLAAIKAANIPDAQVDITDGVTYEQHSWNMASLTKKFGADGAKALMEAVKYIYDKNAINQRILGNSATPSCSFTTPQTWFFYDIPCYKTDTAKAEDVLTKAGFTKGSDGTSWRRTGPRWSSWLHPVGPPYRVDTMVLVGNQLAAQGIKANNQAVNSSILFKGWTLADSDVPCNLTHGNYDYAEFAWLSTPDPLGSISSTTRSTTRRLGDHVARTTSASAIQRPTSSWTSPTDRRSRQDPRQLQAAPGDLRRSGQRVPGGRALQLADGPPEGPALKNVVNNGSPRPRPGTSRTGGGSSSRPFVRR